jgi:membrane-associated phospholipid phosphatase
MRRLFALGGGEVRWLLGSVVVLALLSADIESGGLLTHVDHVVRDSLQPHRLGAPGWLVLPGNLGEAGVATAVLVAVSMVTAQVTWRLWPLVLGVANLAVGGLVVLVLKTVIARPGPGGGDGPAGYPGYFPSGHTATSAVCSGTAVFLVVCAWSSVRRLDRATSAGRATGMVVGALSAADAVLEDHHWVTDGLGGMLVAFIVLTLGFAAARRHVGRSRSAETVRTGP